MKYIIKNDSDLSDGVAIVKASMVLKYLPEKEGWRNCRILTFEDKYVAIIDKNKSSYTISIRNE